MERAKVDTAIITTRMVDLDAMSNFTMASAEALKKLGRVSVYAFAYERPAVDGVEVHMLGGKNRHSIGTNLRALLGTFRLARELSKYDLLLVVNPDIGSMPAYHLARRYNPALKVVWTFHGLTPTEYVSGSRDRLLMRIRRLAYKPSMRRADLVQVFSNFIKNEVTGWGVSPSKVVVLPFGIDSGKMGSGAGQRIREKYAVGNKFLLLYVGRLVNFKHVDELIEAVTGLNDVYLLVVGGGPERERLDVLAKELDAGKRIMFAGRVPDEELPDYYAACDAWATASRHEGFCVPLIEAMVAGKPVIVPEAGAMPETAGDAGLKYDVGDINGLKGRISMLKDDRKLYLELSNKAISRVKEFEISRVMERYMSLLSA
jgi:glycosyltransferase involved in cell wall biosynthesis